jgi:hypothetical protein
MWEPKPLATLRAFVAGRGIALPIPLLIFHEHMYPSYEHVDSFLAFSGKMISTLRLRIARRTDQRIRFMNEIIVGIQVIKMYAWEKPFAHLVSLARR